MRSPLEEQVRAWSPKTSKLLEQLRLEDYSLNIGMPSRKHNSTRNAAADKERPGASKGQPKASRNYWSESRTTTWLFRWTNYSLTPAGAIDDDGAWFER